MEELQPLIVDMTGFNSYIDGLNLSPLTEYFVHHGRLTQYAKGEFFIKAGEELRKLLDSDGLS